LIVVIVRNIRLASDAISWVILILQVLGFQFISYNFG
jgi:hypothetical protein